jgi:hypothetical protein
MSSINTLTVPFVVCIIAGMTQAAVIALGTIAGRRVVMGPRSMRIRIRRGPSRAR